ncbi:MAG: hypothetical protein Q8896_05880 [Bacteroidota bacterium]|nr:hypothetical protein [Bacteroidota bacterium]
MARRIIYTFVLSFLLLAPKSEAQVLPRAGTHFTFGIPEGGDAIDDPTLGSGTSVLTLNIVSLYDGKGIITSPNGFCFEFSFTSNNVTTVTLPYSFMHLKDVGKTNKGILIKTSQPVNVVLHDFLEAAGEATQIYPDDALGTDYRITAWGIYDDFLTIGKENNHSQFLITATSDSTDVTIVPSVKTVDNHAANVPINITLNRGECYMVKADSLGTPIDMSLTHSTVRASRPVSVITAISCGYVPLGIESCNEMLDELLPRRITDSIFYLVPLQDVQVQNTVVFTSDKKDFWIFGTNGSNFHTTQGRVELQIDQPEMYSADTQVQCFLLSEGSSLQFGDPSIVSVFPLSQYTDTMIWYTPPFSQNGFPFVHYISVLYPTSAEGNVLLDGIQIASLSKPQQITSSTMSGTVAIINPGVHRLTSPVPIFAMASGYNTADSYSFIPGTVAPKLPEDTLMTSVGITATTAKTCHTFEVPISLSFHKDDDLTSVHLIANYDPTILTLVSVSLGPAAQGGQWTTDTRTPGVILVDAGCLRPFTDSDAVIIATFGAGTQAATTSITAKAEILGGDQAYKIISGNANKVITIEEFRDTMMATFAISAGQATVGGFDTAIISLLTPPSEAVDLLDLYVTYNHDLLWLIRADTRNTIIPTTTTVLPKRIDPSTDEIRIPLQPSVTFTAGGPVARLIFSTYVTDSISGAIGLHAVIGNSRPCALDILADEVSDEFRSFDTCGTAYMRAVIRHEPFSINSIVPNPSSGSFTVEIDRRLFGGEPLHISLIDMLGNEVWSTDYLSSSITEYIPCSTKISDGSYILRAAISGHTESRKVVIRN